MNICIFDTETISIHKPFCYNIGYVIVNATTGEILCEKDYIIQQVWHNIMLFETAYYQEKRQLYINAMRSRKATMIKYGYAMQQMRRDLIQYGVEMVFAYNSPFDDRVFTFNCDWYKCQNPLDNIPIKDIRAFAHNFLCDSQFKAFCEQHEQFTESGHYSTTAETLYRYITNSPDFIEEHTALADSQIETDILFAAIARDADLNKDYQIKTSIPRLTNKTLTVKFNRDTILITNYKTKTKRENKDGMTLYLKGE